MRNILSAMAVLIATTAATAQEPQRLTLPQLIPGNPDYLYAKRLLGTRWTEDGSFDFTHPDSASSAAPRPKQGPGTPSADGQWRAVGGKSLDGVRAGDYDGPRLYLINAADTTQILEVSDNAEGDIVWGQSVHRNEFGIDGGLFWSPEGHKLAFYRMDETMVQAYPLVNTDAREAEAVWTKYPMAGMKSHHVTLGVYDPDTRQTVWLRTNEPESDADFADPEHYLACVTWRPDGKQLLVAELNRKQNHMRVRLYDAEHGYGTQLIDARDAKYIEPQHRFVFLPGSNDRFLWLDRSGVGRWQHIHLFELKASKLRNGATGWGIVRRQVTSGPWEVTDIVGFDAKGKTAYFYATKDGPLQQNLYTVDLTKKDAPVRRLTREDGWHDVLLSPDGTRFYDTYTNHATPRVCQLVDVKSGRSEVLYTAPDPFDGYAFPDVEVGTLKAADGRTDLYYRLVKPTDFDPSRRYPVIVYLYNGPHAQLVQDVYKWGGGGFYAHWANLGYVVFTIDGRGSERRGLDFEQAIWHNLGDVEGQDQMQGIAYLKTLPFVDADRIGIHGWSYGGFMTTYMMLNYPDVFKVGVCGGPVLDWSRYEVMYGERYMGTPEDNPEGYARNRLVDQAGRLRGRLLLIHDDQDATVVPQHTFQFLKNAVAAGTHPDLFIYPGHEHNVRGKDRIHLYEHVTRYFEEHLKP